MKVRKMIIKGMGRIQGNDAPSELLGSSVAGKLMKEIEDDAPKNIPPGGKCPRTRSTENTSCYANISLNIISFCPPVCTIYSIQHYFNMSTADGNLVQ